MFWSPADWAWTGGLMDALLPTLYFGRPIVAFNGRFSPELAFGLMAAARRDAHLFVPDRAQGHDEGFCAAARPVQAALQGLMSAGEAVGDAVFDYCRQQLGVTVNEMFGQTEINYVVGNCAMNGAPVPAAAAEGCALPGSAVSPQGVPQPGLFPTLSALGRWGAGRPGPAAWARPIPATGWR